MNKESSIDRQIAFRLECKILNMAAEYGADHFGEASWMIFTDLSEEELEEKYREELQTFRPYVYMTLDMYEPMLESNSNERKHRWRMENTYDLFGYVDGEMELYHPELVTGESDEPDYSDLYEALAKLTVRQRRRLCSRYFDEMTNREIASQEAVSEQAISVSNKESIKKLKKLLGTY